MTNLESETRDLVHKRTFIDKRRTGQSYMLFGFRPTLDEFKPDE